MPASHCALKCISGKNIGEGSPDLVASQEDQILGVLPTFGQSSRPIVIRGNLVLNGGSNATWSLRPKITLRAINLGFSQCHLLHNGSKFGT
jgi:hypothetical protein